MWAFEAAAPICFAFQVEVGTRVKVVRGRRALGATGVVFWVRFTLPRFREDQLQRFAWKFLIPLALANIAVTAVLKVAL